MYLIDWSLRLTAVLILSVTYCATLNAAHAQETPMDMDMNDGVPLSPADTRTPPAPKENSQPDMGIMGMSKMSGLLGPYDMTRDASGTSWLPESSPHRGVEAKAADWNVMAEGNVNVVFDDQGGSRGADKTYSTSMAMLMGDRPVGEKGTFGLRSMFSLDPLMGSNGYPLLFATGETANGHAPLVDRQHPHDLIMELASTYSYKLGDGSAIFGYVGLPGEPALGPTAFMHRFSGMDNPEAPITHHWLDSTHISYGVVTAGYVYNDLKFETSTFKGREPDQYRSDIEEPKLDSVATRVTYNPERDLSVQASWGYLKSPEQLMPNVNENRITTSASYNLPFNDNNWATTFAWGRKINQPGHELDGFLLESELVLRDANTFFARAEKVDEDELFDGTPLRNAVVNVSKLSLGYIRDVNLADHLKVGVGGLVSRYDYHDSAIAYYGSQPTSFMLFMRLKLI